MIILRRGQLQLIADPERNLVTTTEGGAMAVPTAFEVRADFAPVADLAQRALIYAQELNRLRVHLRHREDFDKVYSLPPEQQRPLENIYPVGRTVASELGYLLCEFNYEVAEYPTFKSFVDAVEDYTSRRNGLESAIAAAKPILANLEDRIWAIEQMVDLARKQVEILKALESWVATSKKSNLYRQEAGLPGQMSRGLRHHLAGIWSRHGSEIIVGVIVTVVGGLILAALS